MVVGYFSGGTSVTANEVQLGISRATPRSSRYSFSHDGGGWPDRPRCLSGPQGRDAHGGTLVERAEVPGGRFHRRPGAQSRSDQQAQGHADPGPRQPAEAQRPPHLQRTALARHRASADQRRAHSWAGRSGAGLGTSAFAAVRAVVPSFGSRSTRSGRPCAAHQDRSPRPRPSRQHLAVRRWG